MTEAPFYVGAPAWTEPAVPSETRTCDVCGIAIWVDKRLLEHADHCTARICVACFVRIVKHEA